MCSRPSVLALLAVSVLSPSVSAILLGDVKFLFGFGDSYTANGYDPAIGLNPLVGQTLSTTSGSLNWFEYLAESSGVSDNWWDLAAIGATTSNQFVDQSPVPSFVEQVTTFQTYFTPGASPVVWDPTSSLFCLFFGINDVGSSYLDGLFLPSLIDEIFFSYSASFGKVYATGARNFLILNVPPTDRTPLVETLYTSLVQALFKSNVALYNAHLAQFVASVPTLFPGASVTTFDTNALLTTILDDPAPYGILVGDTYCLGYSTLTNDPSASLASCSAPLSEYFYWNSYHIAFPIHKLIAHGAEAALAASTSRKLRQRGGLRISEWA